jgi:hypothetical protein
MKTSTIVALVFAASLSSPIAAHAQSEEPYRHYRVHRYQGPHHAVHHHFVAHTPAPTIAPVAATAAPAALPFGLGLPKIAPLPNNKGDEDGLSDDVNDCNKGCIDGNPE